MVRSVNDVIKKNRYPGRFIVIGRDRNALVAIYGATGRSPSSLARVYEQHANVITATSSDKEIAKTGNPDILEYEAFRFFENGFVVSNGRQGTRVMSLTASTAQAQLDADLAQESYEPDKYKTPRITGCYIESESGMSVALHVIRSIGEKSERTSWNIKPAEHEGYYLATYSGEDVRPTPSFSGSPLPIKLKFGSVKVAARAIFDALAPVSGQQDYRVAVIAVYKQQGKEPEVSIINGLQEIGKTELLAVQLPYLS